MSDEQKTPHMLPLVLVKPGTMSREDITRAEERSFICIVECTEPEAARFLDPPPYANIDAQARAAMSLLRYITGFKSTDSITGGALIKWYVRLWATARM